MHSLTCHIRYYYHAANFIAIFHLRFLTGVRCLIEKLCWLFIFREY